MGKMEHYLKELHPDRYVLQYLLPQDFQLLLHEVQLNEEKLMQLKLSEEQQHEVQRIC